MEQKRIIIGGVALVAIGLIVVFAISGKSQKLSQQNRMLTKESDSYKKRNESLASELNRAQRENSEFNDRFARVQADLDRYQEVVKEKEDLQERYDVAIREKNELVDKLAKAKADAGRTPSAPVMPQGGGDDAYWAAVLKDKANLETTAANLKEELREVKARFAEIEAAKASLDLEIKGLKDAKEMELKTLASEKADLERRLGYNERSIDSLSMELVREKKESRRLRDDYEYMKRTLQGENDMLKQEIGNLRGQITNLSAEINNLSKERVELSNKLQKSELAKADLERRSMDLNALLNDKSNEISDLRQRYESAQRENAMRAAAPVVYSQPAPVVQPCPVQPAPVQPCPRPAPVQAKPVCVAPQSSVELPPIIVRPATPAPSQCAVTGKVLEVNIGNKFIIADIGEDAGVRSGMTFGVFRGNNRIATVEVIQTRKNISAADIKNSSQSIRVGDIVK